MGLSLAPLNDFDIGALIAGIAGFAAWRAGSLSASGALAAFAVGTAVYGSLGPRGAAVLFTFFLTSVALSRYGRARKRVALADVSKTGARDAGQVLANGGIAALCALAAHAIDARYAAAFGGAFAAATADTWGTEIGSLARTAPVSILTRRTLNTGLSGGITLLGTLAEAAGALTIGAVAALSGFGPLLAIAVAGFAGALLDSLLGATVQVLRHCPQCHVDTECEPHRCGANTTVVRGVGFIDNDAVNVAATLCGAGVALLLSPR